MENIDMHIDRQYNEVPYSDEKRGALMELLNTVDSFDIIRLTRLNGGADMELGIYETKARLSELIRILDKEKEIVITNQGKPVAKLVPFVAKERPFGLLKGKYEIPDDIDECDEEIAEMFGA